MHTSCTMRLSFGSSTSWFPPSQSGHPFLLVRTVVERYCDLCTRCSRPTATYCFRRIPPGLTYVPVPPFRHQFDISHN